jgi:hypothetical protein
MRGADVAGDPDRMLRELQLAPRPEGDDPDPPPSLHSTQYEARMALIDKQSLKQVPERIRVIARGLCGELLEELDYLRDALEIMHEQRALAYLADAREAMINLQRQVDPGHFERVER